MKKLIGWLTASNRHKHLLGGIAIGLGADTPYCAAYAAIIVASALELKDRLWGGRWDWADWLLTIAGAALGYGLRLGIAALIASEAI